MSDRKYRHRGYMDSQWEERERQREGQRRKEEERLAPKGRGLGTPTVSVFRCRLCGEKQPFVGQVPLEALCFKCKTPLHSCTHCAFFDTSAPNECLKPVLQRVANKNAANACQLFSPRLVQEFASEELSPKDPRAAFDALFRKR
jgi:hypothetical protein